MNPRQAPTQTRNGREAELPSGTSKEESVPAKLQIRAAHSYSSKALSRKPSLKSRSILANTPFPWAGAKELGEHCKERESTQKAWRDEMMI